MRHPARFAAVVAAAVVLCPQTLFAASNFSGPGLGSAPYVSADFQASPESAPTILDALKQTTPFLEERFRYENARQEGLAHQDASAYTLRSLLGFQTGAYEDFQIVGAAQNTAQIGLKDYSDGVNDKSSSKYPRIGDPYDTSLQLANIGFYGIPNVSLIFGRQYLVIDNQRFIGTSNWRQNRQNFDAMTAKYAVTPDLNLFYSYIFDVNRSPGSRSALGTYQMNTHAMHASYTGVKDFKFSLYSYLENIDNQPSLSNTTSGLRTEYQHSFSDAWKITGVGEYAHQTSYADAAHGFGLNYYEVEPGMVWTPNKFVNLTQKAGYEILNGNGVSSIQTPLASQHTQNGWADIFSTTPTQGLKDASLSTTVRVNLPVEQLGPSKFQFEWHDFRASNEAQHYGNEFDFDFSQPFMKYFTAELQLADYHAIDYGADTKKIMAFLTIQY